MWIQERRSSKHHLWPSSCFPFKNKICFEFRISTHTKRKRSKERDRERERERFYVVVLFVGGAVWFLPQSSHHLKVSFSLSQTTYTEMLIIVWDHHNEIQLFQRFRFLVSVEIFMSKTWPLFYLFMVCTLSSLRCLYCLFIF